MTDRQRDGLHGSVKSVTTVSCERARRFGRWVESERELQESAVYDEAGSLVERTFYGPDGVPLTRYVFTIDEHGRRVTSEVSSADGVVLETAAYEYSPEGVLIVDSITDGRRPDGVAYRHDVGVVRDRQVVTRSRATGVEGRKEILTCDMSGNPVRLDILNADGTVDHHWIFGYNRSGQRTSEISYWSDGSFRTKELRRYNDHGDEYKVTVYAQDGSLEMKWAYTYRHDAALNWIRRVAHVRSREYGTWHYRAVGAEYRTIEYWPQVTMSTVPTPASA